MVTIKGRSQAWENLGKGRDGIMAWDHERSRKEIGYGEVPAQPLEDTGMRFHSLKESLLFPKPRKCNHSLTKARGAHSLSLSLPSIAACGPGCGSSTGQSTALKASRGEQRRGWTAGASDADAEIMGQRLRAPALLLLGLVGLQPGTSFPGRWSWTTWSWMRQCSSLFRGTYALHVFPLNLAITAQILLSHESLKFISWDLAKTYF